MWITGLCSVINGLKPQELVLKLTDQRLNCLLAHFYTQR